MSLFSRNRWLIVTIAHYVVLFIFEQLNFYLNIWGIEIMVTAMLLSFSSLSLTHTQGALSLIPIALYLDSHSPLPFGTSLVILIGLHYFIVVFRKQFRREVNSIGLGVALLANLAIHLLYTAFASAHLGAEGLDGLRIGLNLLCSSLVIGILNPFYSSLLDDLLGLFGIKLAQEQRQAR